MKKFLIIQFIVTFLVTPINTIGVRQLQEFNDAKKEVEKIIHSSVPLSDEAYKKFEKNLAVIAAVDKQAALKYKAQLPAKKADSNVEQSNINVEPPFEMQGKMTEPSKQESVVPDPELIKMQKVSGQDPQRISFESEKAPTIEIIETTPVFNPQSPLPMPVITAKPEERETPVFNIQAFDVPVSQKQREQEKNQAKQKIIAQLLQLENAVDQVVSKLNSLVIDESHGFKGQGNNFQKWNETINNYENELSELKALDKELYSKKMEKVKKIEVSFISKLTDQVSLSITLLGNIIDPLIALLQGNEGKKKSTLLGFSNDNTEFNKVSYVYFFGSVGSNLWRNPRMRNNLEWFKENKQQVLQLYWENGIEQYFDLLFEYYNKKKIIEEDNARLLKSKMTSLQEKIGEYKKLLANAYNGMLAIQKSLPVDDKNEQMKLLEKNDKKDSFNYENHLKLLDEAQQDIQNKFVYKLWPDDRPSLV